MIDNLGLVPSLRALFKEIKQHKDIEIHFFHRCIPKRFDQEKELSIYRVVQEALNNVKKHSGAANVNVDIDTDGERMSIVIRDDGQGFELPDEVHRYGLSGKLGLLGMHERAQSIGAFLEVDSAVGRGTKVVIRVDGDDAPATGGEPFTAEE